MYRVIAIIGGALTLAACSSAQMGGLDAFKPAPMMDTVSFETEPAGADVKVSNGQTCKTPCALALPVDQPLNVTFSLAGYESESETLAPVVATGSPPRLNPNPVTAELSPAAAKPAAPKGRTTKKPAAKPATKKPVAKKQAAKPAAKPAATPAAAPAAASPAPTFAPAPAASSPWPAPPPQR
jgi:hypothetical protein